ncbi:hypothetical protein T492DRAFT_873665 [Pavlovales sp. CCMP2436]|nr:hypothetical protein T492DRAFT_873665 [Pavlovales sp. CCMP2436]
MPMGRANLPNSTISGRGHAFSQINLALLLREGRFAGERELVPTCCIGCGKMEQLQTCSKCLTAKFCGAECVRRMWPVHKPGCKAWREEKAAAAAEETVEKDGDSQEAEEEEEDITSLPTKELKRRLDRLSISYVGVLERPELVELLSDAVARE